jgi:hypothetical protein
VIYREGHSATLHVIEESPGGRATCNRSSFSLVVDFGFHPCDTAAMDTYKHVDLIISVVNLLTRLVRSKHVKIGLPRSSLAVLLCTIRVS